MNGYELLRRLAQRRVKFPVLIVSATLENGEKRARECAGPELRVSFLGKPIDYAELVAIVDRGLRVETDATAKGIVPGPLPPTRPLRIIHVDDEHFVLEAVGMIMLGRLKNLELLQFERSLTAWEVLSRFQPDLLITDDRMPGMRGSELVRRLAERGIKYPIIVISAWELTANWVKEFADRGMRISHLPAPFDIPTFCSHLSRDIGPLETPPAKPGG